MLVAEFVRSDEEESVLSLEEVADALVEPDDDDDDDDVLSELS